MFNVHCFGNETNLLDCQYDNKGSCNYYYSQSVAAFCQKGKMFEVLMLMITYRYN